MYGDSRSMPQSSVMVDGRHVVDAVAMDRLYINDSTNPSLGNLSSKTNSGSSVVSNAQIPQSRPQGRGAGVGSTSYPPASLHSQVNKVSLPTQSHGVTRTPSQNRVQPAVQVPVQQLGQRPDSGSQSSSPPKTALSVNSVESGSGEADSYSESSKLKTALVGKGKGMAQGIGAGSFIYSGAQIMGTSGNMNITHGDQNFPHTPAFLPGKVYFTLLLTLREIVWVYSLWIGFVLPISFKIIALLLKSTFCLVWCNVPVSL